jgi:hypothetical protein
MTFVKGHIANPAGRTIGSKSRVTLVHIDERLLNIEQELAAIRAMLPNGCDPKDYIAGRDSAKLLKGAK